MHAEREVRSIFIPDITAPGSDGLERGFSLARLTNSSGGAVGGRLVFEVFQSSGIEIELFPSYLFGRKDSIFLTE